MRTSKKSLLLLTSLILAISVSSTNTSFSADKIGGPCAKKGATSTISGTPVKCAPMGSKQIWVSTGKPAGANGNSNNSNNSGSNKAQFATFDPDMPPQFITADFVDPSKIFLVSKFRSGIGHDYSVGTPETCRSMKHYLSAMDPDAPDYKIEGGGSKDAMPLAVNGIDVPIYSPADGLASIESYDNVLLNRAVAIAPMSQPGVNIRLMHVTPLNSLKNGQKVKAGQQVGMVLRNQSFDVAIDVQVKDAKYKGRNVSVFMAMTNKVFAEWQKRGAVSRDQFVLTKAFVDAHPWKCATDPNEKRGNQLFAVNYMLTPDTFALSEVPLIGYDEMTAKMRAKYGM